MEEKDTYNPVKLKSAANRVEAEMIGELLNNSGIPSYTKDLESGNYMNICMGYSIFGTDIYVREGDLEKARQVLAGMEASAPEETDGGEEEISADEIRKSKSRAVETVLTVILGAVVLLTILSVVL